MRDDQTHQPIDKSRGEHERHEARLRPAVKNVAGKDEPKVAPALARGGEQVIAEQRQRQEIINENMLGETAIELMEKYTITQLVITDKKKSPAGVVHLHDLVKAGLG